MLGAMTTDINATDTMIANNNNLGIGCRSILMHLLKVVLVQSGRGRLNIGGTKVVSHRVLGCEGLIDASSKWLTDDALSLLIGETGSGLTVHTFQVSLWPSGMLSLEIDDTDTGRLVPIAA